MKLYHGTDLQTAAKIVKGEIRIDPQRGGGELGQGFYLNSSSTEAYAWAKLRFDNWAVVEFDIANSDLDNLDWISLSQSSVTEFFKCLKQLDVHRTVVGRGDGVCGPFKNLQLHGIQFKFESIRAVRLLKGAKRSVVQR